MQNQLVQSVDILRKVKKAKNRQKIVRDLSSSDIKALCEFCANLLHGNIPIDEKSKTRLSPYQRSIKDLANRRIGAVKKRKVINQRGGFLPLLASVGLPLITELVVSAVKKGVKTFKKSKKKRK